MERILQSGSATDALRDRLQGYFDELLYQAGSGAPPRLLEDAYRRGMRTLRAFYMTLHLKQSGTEQLMRVNNSRI